MTDVAGNIAILSDMKTTGLQVEWRRLYRAEPPGCLSRDLLIRGIAYKLQERVHGGLTQSTKRRLRLLAEKLDADGNAAFVPRRSLKPGAKLVREWRGRTHCVIALESGFEFEGRRYRSLTKIAREITGAHWSGPRFFGLASPSSRSGLAKESSHE